MASESAAATPVAPAEGSVIAIHSLDEWSIQIEEANSAKKLVLFLSLYFASLCVSLQGTWLDQSMSTLVLESAGQIVFCFDWTVLVCADL